jgi:hypothetical protein
VSDVSVLPGFKDLKPKDILVWNANGTIMVDMGEKIEIFQLQLSPTGCVTARPMEEKQPDQTQQRRVISREQRLAMTDQGAVLLEQERGG